MWASVPIGVLVGLVGTFLAVLFCGGAEKCIVQLFGLEEGQKYEALKFLGIGMGGAVLALQAVIANKRAQAMENTAKAQADAAKAQAKATQEQAKANKNTEQGQRQERLKNAIEHLGHSSDSVRLGGAYELFHLAEDEDTAENKKDLRQTVLDILCAHIRQTTREREYRKDYKQNPSEEIQSLLTLLFVQEHKVFTGLHINLQESWLNESNLNKARLEKAHLRGAQLHGAHLEGAQLHEAYLAGARLHGASCNLIYPDESFETVINRRIGEESDLSGVISAGGLTQEAVASIGKGLPDEDANELREKLKMHIGDAGSRVFGLPKNSGAHQGTYTKEAAAQWIAEYKTALSAVSESG